MVKEVKLGAFFVEKRNEAEGVKKRDVHIGRESEKLPKGWKWVKLCEICKINPSKSEVRHLPDDLRVTFVPMTAVSEISGKIEKPEVRLLGEVRKGYTYFRENDILFAKITPCMENGKSAIARNLVNGIGFGSTEFHIIRPLEKVLPEWIFFYIRQKSFRDEAARNMTGSVGQQRVPVHFLKKVKIPLPPLEEQKRIVSCLEELLSRVEEAKRLRKLAREETEKIMQAALNKVFSKAEEKGWRWIRLKDIAKIISGGTPRRGNPEFWGGNIPWLTPSELEDGKINYVTDTKEKITKLGLEKSNAQIIPLNSVLLTCTASVGKVAINKVELTTNQQFNSFIFDKSRIIPEFLAYYLLFSKKEIEKLGGETTFRFIRKEIIGCFKLPLPSIEEQRRVVTYLNKVGKIVESLKKLQQRTEEELEKLVPSILDRAFRGEL